MAGLLNFFASSDMTTAVEDLSENVMETSQEETTTAAQTIVDVGAEVSQNINEAVENANQFLATLESYIPKLVMFGINILIALVIFVIGKFIIKILLKFANRFMSRANIEISVQRFLDSLFKTLLYVILFIIICNQVGIQTTSFIALLTSAGLTVGLALQGSFSNFAGGILILLLKPFKVGDYILDGSSGKEGTVQRIDLFYTVIVTVDNKQVTIPNGSLSNADITNYSAFDTRRVDLTVGVSYECDIMKAKELVRLIGEKEPSRLEDKPAEAMIKDLAASEVTIELRVWVKAENYWNAFFRMKEQLKLVLDEAEIEIPFQQVDVHVHQS